MISASWKLRALRIALILPFSLFAQAYHEIDFHYGIGASELSLNNVPGAAISLYPIKNFGLSAGLEFAWRQKSSHGEKSGRDSSFNWKFEDYEQTLSAKILQVPVLLKYRNDFWYASAGAKLGVMNKMEAEVSWEGLTVSEPFGSRKDSSFKTRIHPSKILAALAFEYGINMKFSDNFNMLVGVFADYSFLKSINRKPPVVEIARGGTVERIHITDNWRIWQPWSVGAQLKLAFGFSSEPAAKKDSVVSEPPPPPPPPTAEEIVVPQAPEHEEASDLPRFLLDREPDFAFNYPGERVSQMDSIHLELVSQIANLLKAKPSSQLHCVGYSEELLSESTAYETAFERALRIRYTLVQFYGISESRLFTYSQGSKNAGYRRTECYHIF